MTHCCIDDEVMRFQYEKIRWFFADTTEPFDDLEWDGKVLKVWLGGEMIEEYSYDDLKELIKGFAV